MYRAGDVKRSGEIKLEIFSQLQKNISKSLEKRLLNPGFDKTEQQQFVLQSVNQALELDQLSGREFPDWAARSQRSSEYARAVRERFDAASNKIIDIAAHVRLDSHSGKAREWEGEAFKLFPGFFITEDGNHDSLRCECTPEAIVTQIWRHPGVIPTGTMDEMFTKLTGHLVTHYQDFLEAHKPQKWWGEVVREYSR